MGMFGFAEIIVNLEQAGEQRVAVDREVSGLMPTLADFKASAGAILRGTGLGSVLGILPGGGALLASFAAYTLEKKISDDAGDVRQGRIEGVAGARGGQQRRARRPRSSRC